MKPSVIFGVLALAFIITGVTRADVIYTEDFGEGQVGGVQTSMYSEGWGGWYGSTATDCSTSSTTGVYLYPGTSTSDGRYVYTATNALIATDEVPVVSTSDLQSISFLANHNSTSATARMGVMIESNYYVTDETFSMKDAGSSSDWGLAETHTFTWTNAASAWRVLDFVPGSTLAVGDLVTSDLSGDVVAFGVFFSSNAMRIDNFTVSAVPEPGTLLLVFAGLVPLLVWPRLRRRST